MINTKRMADIPPNSNPFYYDMNRMGVFVASNVCVMFTTHNDKPAHDIVIVNVETGERVKLSFYKQKGGDILCVLLKKCLRQISRVRVASGALT